MAGRYTTSPGGAQAAASSGGSGRRYPTQGKSVSASGGDGDDGRDPDDEELAPRQSRPRLTRVGFGPTSVAALHQRWTHDLRGALAFLVQAYPAPEAQARGMEAAARRLRRLVALQESLIDDLAGHEPDPPEMQSLDGLWQQAFRTASAGQRGLQLELGSTPGLQVRTRAPADVQGLTALLLFSHAAVGSKGSIPVTHERLDDARLASKVRLPAGIWERMGDDPAVLPPAPIEPIEWWLAVRGLARAGARVEVDRAAEGEPLRVVWSTM